MIRSEAIDKISVALVSAQKKITFAKKDTSNTYFKSKYADLNSVIVACKEALNSEDITILQPHRVTEGDAIVETILIHSSGQYIGSETMVKVVKANDPQALGSAISYARRYGLQSLISLPADDDDGETAQGRGASSEVKVTKAATVDTNVAETNTTKAASAARTPFRKPTKTETTGDDI